MSNVPASGRSFKKITRSDLLRLAEIARLDMAARFSAKPRWRRLYAKSAIATALCQGSAAHFLTGERGIHDFDIWTFFARHPSAPFPYRWLVKRDFGSRKFGVSPDKPQFIGRRVDCIGRSIDAEVGDDPAAAVIRYLFRARTKSSRELAKRPVILLLPEKRLGEVVWTP